MSARLLLLMWTPALLTLGATNSNAAGGACTQSANQLQTACTNNADEEYRVAIAACLNMSDDAARDQCTSDAQSAHRDGRSTCQDVTSVRLDVCDAVGDVPYEPAFGGQFADHFVDPTQIGSGVQPNLYYPLLPGSEWKYKTTYKNDNGVSL